MPHKRIQHKRRIEAEKNGGKDGKAFSKVINNAVYGKDMENLRNRIDVNLVSNEKDYLKWTSKASYTSQKLFGNYLIAIRRIKATLTLKKPAYVGMCVLDLSKVLMDNLHYDYIKNKYGNSSRILFTDCCCFQKVEIRK